MSRSFRRHHALFSARRPAFSGFSQITPFFAVGWCHFCDGVFDDTNPDSSDVRATCCAACIARVRRSSIKIPHIITRSPCRLSGRQASMLAATASALGPSCAPSSSTRGARERNSPAASRRVVWAQARSPPTRHSPCGCLVHPRARPLLRPDGARRGRNLAAIFLELE